jgi:cytochrome c biogenesis protein CcmG/thiol:disulfide interchange protein DsbE
MAADDTRTRPSAGGFVLRALGIAAAVSFIALLAYGLIARAPDTTIDDRLADAETAPAPGFTLDVLSGGDPPPPLASVVERATSDGRLSLDELRGTPVVLNFWASWCDPCRVEAPVLERGWRESGRRGVLFLGLDMQDVTDDAREFLTAFRISYPNVREADKDTARRYGATGLPETYFISARGRVVAHVIGAITPAQLREGVAAARSGGPVQLGAGGESRPTR